MRTRSELGTMCLAAVLIVTAEGCNNGSGDIGPNLLRLPDSSFRVLVRDDDDRAVVNAAVSIEGSNAIAFTESRGRGEFYIDVNGRALLRIGTTTAIVEDGDVFAALAVAVDAEAERIPAFDVHLANLSQSQQLDVATGVLASTEVLDDSGRSGAVLTLPAGTAIASGTLTTLQLRLGRLRSDHLPPLVPEVGGARLISRGIHIAIRPFDAVPNAATISPGAALSIPNDLGLAPGSTAELFELDPSDGEWRPIGSGAVDPSGAAIETVGTPITRAALVAFATPTMRTADFTGRLLSVDRTRPLARARVRAGQRVAFTNDAGRFTLSAIPIALADGAPLRPTLSVRGGRTQVQDVLEIALDPAVLDLGDVPTAFHGVTDFRTLLVARGKSQPFTSVQIGSTTLPGGFVGITSRSAELTIPALSDRFIGFTATIPDPNSIQRVLELDGRFFLPEGRRNFDLRLFYASRGWTETNRGGTLFVPLDREGAGRLTGVDIVRRNGGVDDFLDRTRDEFEFREDVRREYENVASFQSTDGTRTVFSVCSVVGLEVGRMEMPLHRARRSAIGFDTFGIVEGDFRVPFDPSGSQVYLVRVTNVENTDRWFDAVLEDRSILARAPVFLDPMRDGGTEFRYGVPSRGGHVVAIRAADRAGRTEFVNMVYEVDGPYPPDRVQILRTTGFGVLGFDTEFTATDAFVGLDASLDPAAVRSHLAFALPDGRVVEIARDHDGNLTRRGDDAVLTLPAEPWRGSTWMTVLEVDAEVSGVARRQRTIHRFDSNPAASTPNLEVPQITTPVAGGQVPVAGFDVAFTLPSTATYATLRLTRDDGTVMRDWFAVLPPEQTSFRFRPLPEIPSERQMLAAGTYTLELCACRVTRGPVFQQSRSAYQAIASRFYGIGAFERQLDAIASMKITLQVVP
ncbi:MAG: hypothetical protein AB7I19_06940 [Planctomycetota bacterium]